jgi:micrococcal nuclease
MDDLRRSTKAAVAAAIALALAGAAAAGQSTTGRAEHVARVVDGDTVDLTDGAKIRLVQIDTPELGSGECYSRAAAKALRRLLPQGAAVGLEADPRLDQVDRYGRLLRYLWRGKTNLNVELVREGAATVWFYGHDTGRYAGRLLRAAEHARALGKGLWGACVAVWDPYGPATTYQRRKRTAPHLGGNGCDPAYPDVCIPPPPPDLDCADIRFRRFRVLPPDPHNFDGDHNGIGCERS